MNGMTEHTSISTRHQYQKDIPESFEARASFTGPLRILRSNINPQKYSHTDTSTDYDGWAHTDSHRATLEIAGGVPGDLCGLRLYKKRGGKYWLIHGISYVLRQGDGTHSQSL